MKTKRIYINKDNEIIIDNKIATLDVLLIMTEYAERVLKNSNKLIIQSDNYTIKIEKQRL